VCERKGIPDTKIIELIDNVEKELSAEDLVLINIYDAILSLRPPA
jgi:hypothetical protein